MKKNSIIKSFLFAASISALVSCKPQLTAPAVDKGSLNLSRFVALGNSITSGYADNALYYDGQQVAFVNLMAQQFKLAGGGDFKQALTSPSSVGVGGDFKSRLVLKMQTDCKGVTSLAPGSLATSGDMSIFDPIYATSGPFDNIAVAGAKVITAVFKGYGYINNAAIGKFNPFYARLASDVLTSSMLGDAVARNPTFFSLFLGNNDVLGYALAGGAADPITPSSGPVGVGFDASIDTIVAALTANNAKGVVGNIPNVTSLPYFNTVPYNGLLLDAPSASALSAAYAALGITFHTGNNAFIIADASAPGGMRQIHAGELLLLATPQDSLKCGGWGSMKPIPGQYVLTSNEIAQLDNAVSAFNAKLKSVADAKGLAYVDMNSFMSKTKAGFEYNGIALSASYVTGGTFTLDGIHLTPIGNALLANEFLKAINAKYGSTIPLLEASNYKGITFP